MTFWYVNHRSIFTPVRVSSNKTTKNYWVNIHNSSSSMMKARILWAKARWQAGLLGGACGKRHCRWLSCLQQGEGLVPSTTPLRFFAHNHFQGLWFSFTIIITPSRLKNFAPDSVTSIQANSNQGQWASPWLLTVLIFDFYLNCSWNHLKSNKV